MVVEEVMVASTPVSSGTPSSWRRLAAPAVATVGTLRRSEQPQPQQQRQQPATRNLVYLKVMLFNQKKLGSVQRAPCSAELARWRVHRAVSCRCARAHSAPSEHCLVHVLRRAAPGQPPARRHHHLRTNRTQHRKPSTRAPDTRRRPRLERRLPEPLSNAENTMQRERGREGV